MRIITALIFSFTFFNIGISQNPYNPFGTENSEDLIFQSPIPEFTYDSQLIEDFIYKNRTYKNGEIELVDSLQFFKSDSEKLAFYSITEVNDLINPKVFNGSKVSDTINYQPQKNEVIFKDSSVKKLYDTPYGMHALDELVFIKDGKIIATHDESVFTKFSYDKNQNITEIISYQAVIEYNPNNDNGEQGIPTYCLSPYTFIKMKYDNQNRVISKWFFMNQEFMMGSSNTEYDDSKTLYHGTFNYDKKGSLNKKVLTHYHITLPEKDSATEKELQLIYNNASSIDFIKLKNYTESKEITNSSINFNRKNQIKSIENCTENWIKSEGEFIKEFDYLSSTWNITYKKDKVNFIESSSTLLPNGIIDTSWKKTEVVRDENSFLKSKVQYVKTTSTEKYQIAQKETMDFMK